MMMRRENEQNNKLQEKQDQIHEDVGESELLIGFNSWTVVI